MPMMYAMRVQFPPAPALQKGALHLQVDKEPSALQVLPSLAACRSAIPAGSSSLCAALPRLLPQGHRDTAAMRLTHGLETFQERHAYAHKRGAEASYAGLHKWGNRFLHCTVFGTNPTQQLPTDVTQGGKDLPQSRKPHVESLPPINQTPTPNSLIMLNDPSKGLWSIYHIKGYSRIW